MRFLLRELELLQQQNAKKYILFNLSERKKASAERERNPIMVWRPLIFFLPIRFTRAHRSVCRQFSRDLYTVFNTTILYDTTTFILIRFRFTYHTDISMLLLPSLCVCLHPVSILYSLCELLVWREKGLHSAFSILTAKKVKEKGKNRSFALYMLWNEIEAYSFAYIYIDLTPATVAVAKTNKYIFSVVSFLMEKLRNTQHSAPTFIYQFV